jgi:16S rRNA U1498 N3-methylase RsmE
MISIIHYISACRRLKESDKTIMMMGGESECNEMILGQNEMIKLEKQYYHDEMIKLAIYIVIVLPLITVLVSLYNIFK